MSRLTPPVCWDAGAALGAHAACAGAVAQVRIAAREVAPGVGCRVQRALEAVLAGDTSRWRPPVVYRDPTPAPRTAPSSLRGLHTLDAALARCDEAVERLRQCTRLTRRDPRWEAVTRARARDQRAVDAAWGRARDDAARTVQAAWRRAWYQPGMAVWDRRMRREFQDLARDFSGDSTP